MQTESHLGLTGIRGVNPTPFPIRLTRVVRVAVHVLRALVLGAAVFPFVSSARRAGYVQRWSLRLLSILKVRLEVVGHLPERGHRAMIAANHVSWLDIFAINAVLPVRFIAKQEIRQWPILGWICESGGALFIDRTRRRHIADINREVIAALSEGDVITVFPEGKTSDGMTLAPFHASFLEPALKAGAQVHPVAIRYLKRDGGLCPEAAYVNKSMVTSLLAIVTQRVIRARLEFLPPVACEDKTRRQVAQEAARLILAALGASLAPDTGIAPDRKA